MGLMITAGSSFCSFSIMFIFGGSVSFGQKRKKEREKKERRERKTTNCLAKPKDYKFGETKVVLLF